MRRLGRLVGGRVGCRLGSRGADTIQGVETFIHKRRVATELLQSLARFQAMYLTGCSRADEEETREGTVEDVRLDLG